MKCEVKWVYWCITKSKTSGAYGISVELFEILRDNAVKVLHSICQKIWKTQQWPQDRKDCFDCNPKERCFQRMFNYHTVALISHVTKVISPSKSLTLHELWNSTCSSWIWKCRGTRDQIANIHWIIKKKKQDNSRNTPTSDLLTMQKPLTVDHNKLWKTCRDWNTRPSYLPSEKSECRSRSNR